MGFSSRGLSSCTSASRPPPACLPAGTALSAAGLSSSTVGAIETVVSRSTDAASTASAGEVAALCCVPCSCSMAAYGYYSYSVLVSDRLGLGFCLGLLSRRAPSLLSSMRLFCRGLQRRGTLFRRP
eukprot:7390924-Prymnesium_polylepis.1